MRTILSTLAVVILAPATALADEHGSVAPPVVLTIDGRTVDTQPQPVQTTPPPPPVQPQPKAETPPQKPKNGYVVPESVPYEGGKLPEGAIVEKRANMTLVGTGVGIAGATYLVSVITALASCPPSSDCTSTKSAAWLYLPLAGPFITAATATSQGGAALAAFDGVVQVVGGAIALAGVLAPRKFVVWQDKTASLKITPTTGAPAMADAKPAMSAGISLTLTHL